jgi:hypothetical protein
LRKTRTVHRCDEGDSLANCSAILPSSLQCEKAPLQNQVWIRATWTREISGPGGGGVLAYETGARTRSLVRRRCRRDLTDAARVSVAGVNFDRVYATPHLKIVSLSSRRVVASADLNFRHCWFSGHRADGRGRAWDQVGPPRRGMRRMHLVRRRRGHSNCRCPRPRDLPVIAWVVSDSAVRHPSVIL